MEDQSDNKQNVILYWIENLVGTGPRFSLNLLITLFGGILYSFNIWSSPYVLAIFGVLSPLLFTFCLYYIIRNFGEEKKDIFPKLFISQKSNTVLMLFDMAIIIGFAILIHAGYLNFLIFRLLQTIIFPIMMLFILRLLYLTITSQDDENPEF